MQDPYAWQDVRRRAPRVHIAASCLEVSDDGETHGLVVDLGPRGARLERPYRGGPPPRDVYLELMIPELDEIIPARGAPCFDLVRPAVIDTGRAGPFRLVRRTGYRIVAAAARDLRLLRDFVLELRRAQRADDDVYDELLHASCYRA